MKTILLLSTLALTAGAQPTNEAVMVKVTGDRVSLRAEPGLDGELLDRAMRDQEMEFFEETNGWAAVQAPDNLDVWVAAEYITNGVVEPAKLNVRSGPSLNYPVINVVEAGDVLNVRTNFNDWLKIAPPPGTRIWISADYITPVVPPEPEPEPESVVEAEPEPEAEPAIEPEVAAEPEEELPPLILELDKNRPQGVHDEIPGILRRANPGLYKLVYISGGIEEDICLVRGSERQLEQYLNRSMLIKGPKYWAKDVDLPIIQPESIHLDPIIVD